MLTRRSRIQEKRLVRSGIFLLFLSIATLIILAVFGIPILAKFATFVSDINTNSAQILEEDKTPPGPPSIQPPLPESVKESTLAVAGRAEANSLLKIYNRGEVVKEGQVGESSTYSLAIELYIGNNNIWTTATDKSGNESIASSTSSVLYDTDPPLLEITNPKEGEEFLADNRTVVVEGKTEEKAKITVNDRLAILKQDGTFSFSLPLTEGENKITVVAEDEAQNKTEKQITVTYSK